MLKRGLLWLCASLLLAGGALYWAWSGTRRGSLQAVSYTLLSLTRSLARTAKLLPGPPGSPAVRQDLREIWATDLSPYDDTELHFGPEAPRARREVLLSDGADRVYWTEEADREPYLEARTESSVIGAPIRVTVPLSSIDDLLRHELWPWAGLVIFGSGVLLPGVALYFWRRERDQREHELRTLSLGLQKAREEEATRIARDLHDDLGQILSVLKLELSREHAGAASPAPLELVSSALASLRQVIRGLRPVLLDEAGLYAAMEWKAREIENDSGVAMVLRLAQPEPDLNPSQRFALFRIFQELVTNSLKHAHPETITVEISTQQRRLTLTVSDDGPGFPQEMPPPGPGGLGLRGLRERVSEMHGSVEINQGPHARVQVSITIA